MRLTHVAVLMAFALLEAGLLTPRYPVLPVPAGEVSTVPHCHPGSATWMHKGIFLACQVP